MICLLLGLYAEELASTVTVPGLSGRLFMVGAFAACVVTSVATFVIAGFQDEPCFMIPKSVDSLERQGIIDIAVKHGYECDKGRSGFSETICCDPKRQFSVMNWEQFQQFQNNQKDLLARENLRNQERVNTSIAVGN